VRKWAGNGMTGTGDRLQVAAASPEHRTQYGTYRIEAPMGGVTPGSAQFRLATFEAADGRSWCLAVVRGTPQSGQFRSLVLAHAHAARSRASLAACDRFAGEAIAYVRSRPEGCRSDYLDNGTPGMEDYAAEAVADIRGALARALLEGDPFRAAVVFEGSTPYLRADVGLVRLMERILPAFEAGLAGGDYHASAAGDMEAEVRARSQFASRQVDLWRGTASRPNV